MGILLHGRQDKAKAHEFGVSYKKSFRGPARRRLKNFEPSRDATSAKPKAFDAPAAEHARVAFFALTREQ
jgi:hypothetical protein